MGISEWCEVQESSLLWMSVRPGHERKHGAMNQVKSLQKHKSVASTESGFGGQHRSKDLEQTKSKNTEMSLGQKTLQEQFLAGVEGQCKVRVLGPKRQGRARIQLCLGAGLAVSARVVSQYF